MIKRADTVEKCKQGKADCIIKENKSISQQIHVKTSTNDKQT